MKIIYNNIIPFPGFAAINLFGVLFVRKGVILTDRIKNHEAIHTAQMKELWYIGFYTFYVLEWIVKLCVLKKFKESYASLSFEREAYENDYKPDYLNYRVKYTWIKHIRK